MTYENVCRGRFISRPNRFIAQVEVGGKVETVHVKNTGRCRELLLPGAAVYLCPGVKPGRKTAYDLISVCKGERLVNIDSQAPNRVFGEFLQSGAYMEGVSFVKPEVRYGASRFDFYAEAGERRIFIEVKGVTLEEDGGALFPDAPTLRGVRHLEELVRCMGEGYEAHAVFVVQMEGAAYFAPNYRTHAAFGDALVAAREAGVRVSAWECAVWPEGMRIEKALPVVLG